MKQQLDARFNVLDQKTMKQFQATFGQTVAKQNLNVAGFLSLMESSGQEVAKKWVVPGKENNIENNINYAEQVCNFVRLMRRFIFPSTISPGAVVESIVCLSFIQAIVNSQTFI